MVWEKNAPDNLVPYVARGCRGRVLVCVIGLLEVGGDTDDAEAAVADVAYDLVAEFTGGYVGFHAFESVE